jgi:hypothetical protein
MGRFLLFFSGLVLFLSPLRLFFASQFSGLVSLSNDKLSIYDLLVFLLLTFNYGLFFLLKNFHPGLLKSL